MVLQPQLESGAGTRVRRSALRARDSCWCCLPTCVRACALQLPLFDGLSISLQLEHVHQVVQGLLLPE